MISMKDHRSSRRPSQRRRRRSSSATVARAVVVVVVVVVVVRRRGVCRMDHTPTCARSIEPISIDIDRSIEQPISIEPISTDLDRSIGPISIDRSIDPWRASSRSSARSRCSRRRRRSRRSSTTRWFLGCVVCRKERVTYSDVQWPVSASSVARACIFLHLHDARGGVARSPEYDHDAQCMPH